MSIGLKVLHERLLNRRRYIVFSYYSCAAKQRLSVYMPIGSGLNEAAKRLYAGDQQA